jgi:hypothetical protein
MKSYQLLLFALAACVSPRTETENTTDSLTQVSDTVAVASAVSGQTTVTTATPGLTVDASLPDSLKGHRLAVYHGEYRLQSSSSAEQARMTIRFEGNNRFSYSINYTVADFCNDDANGSFTVDESNTGQDSSQSEDKNKVITFTLGQGTIAVSDRVNEFGVGTCNMSGDFFRCDGPCPEIKSEDYGIEEAEGDTTR